MKNPKYIESNKEKYKKRLIILPIIIFILVITSLILGKIYDNTKIKELSYDNLTTIKEVIEYYESKYISEEKSKEKGYYLDVYLKFKVLPYNENDESNEQYYTKLLNDCAKVENYRSFRLLDKENNLTVEVICDGNKIVSIIINGIEDYFIYMDSQISMKKFREIPITEFSIQSEILQNCINNNWNPDNIYFGERDSIFEEYYIFFDEGIKTRTINKKIYNIVFDKKCRQDIVNNIFPGMDFSNIKAKLGEPTFSDENLNIIGYKGKDIYVFFSENEISIYRVSQYDTNDFFDLADRYISEELDFLEFMNQLTYLWPDYSDYKYDSKSVFISYPLKGIEIKINYDKLNGIFIFNNIKSPLNKVERYLENTDFVARLQLDLVFEAEKRRVENNKNLLKLCEEYKNNLNEETQNIIGNSLNYEIYPELDDYGLIYTIKFISKFGEQPNRELSDSISSYLWINNNTFIYSKQKKGIYSYNLENGIVTRILSGTDDYKLKGYKDGILKYDNTEIIF